MGAVMWVEVLGRHGEVVERHRIDAPEARIGRALDNDLVVDDPHVAPHHLRVGRSAEGALVAEDLGSVNGLFVEKGTKREARVELAAHPVVRIGRTLLRVRDAAVPVAPERELLPDAKHGTWALALGAAFVPMLTGLAWLEITAEPSASVLLLPLLGWGLLVALWAGGWALISRLFSGQARFGLQMRITLTAAFAILAFDVARDALAFGLASRAVADYSSLGLWLLVVAACYAHLRSIGARHTPFAMGLVVVLVATGAALQYVSRSERREFTGQGANLGELKPPGLRLAPLASSEDFLAGVSRLQPALEEARKKEPGGGLFRDADATD